MRFDYWQHVVLGGTAVALLTWESCSQTGQSRQSSVGGTSPAPLSSSSSTTPSVVGPTTTPASGTSVLTGNGSTTAAQVSPQSAPATGVPGGTVAAPSPASAGTPATPSAGSQSLADCQAKDEAWIPVVNNGTSPSACGDPLVTWCCTRAEVDARFPALTAQIEVQFKQFIDTQNEKLYACSASGASSTTMSLAKIVNGITTYNTITVSGVFPIVPNPDPSPSPCATVAMADLMRASLALDSEEREGEAPAREDDAGAE